MTLEEREKLPGGNPLDPQEKVMVISGKESWSRIGGHPLSRIL